MTADAITSDTTDRHIDVETVRFDRLTAFVRVAGNLDRASAAALWAVLEGHVAAGRRFLRLDLSGLTALDPTAVSGLARTHQELLSRRGTLVVTGVRSLAEGVLRLTGLDKVLFLGGPRADLDSERTLTGPRAGAVG